MVIALDTNILLALWYEDNSLNQQAVALLEGLGGAAELVVSAPVYAELCAGRNLDYSVDELLSGTGIRVDWNMSEQVWRTAGIAYLDYAQRRRKSGATYPRRILTDFLIGAHAQVNGYALLTLDQRHYRAAFPKLKLQKI